MTGRTLVARKMLVVGRILMTGRTKKNEMMKRRRIIRLRFLRTLYVPEDAVFAPVNFPVLQIGRPVLK